jgi:hypothetical protein
MHDRVEMWTWHGPHEEKLFAWTTNNLFRVMSFFNLFFQVRYSLSG